MDLATIYYFIRGKYYGSALSFIEDLLGQETNSRSSFSGIELLVYKSYCFCKLGKASEGIRILKRMNEKNSELQMAVLHALRIAYLNENRIDQESLKQVELSIQNLSIVDVPITGCFVASWLYVFEENYEKARSLVLQLPRSSSTDSKVLNLYGWIEVLSNRDLKSALENFDKSIAASSNDQVDPFLGKARVFQIRRNAAEMHNTLTAALAISPSSLAVHVELTRTAMMLRNWTEVLEITQKILLIQSDCIQSQLYELIYAIIFSGDSNAIESLVADVNENVNAVEATNSFVNAKICSILMAIMMDNRLLWDYVKRFLERALLSDPQNAELILVRARLTFLESDPRKALQIATGAIEFEDGPAPFFHLIQYNLELGNVDEAGTQIDFLKSTHKSILENPQFLYLQVQYFVYREQIGNSSFFDIVHRCIDLQLATVQNLSFGIEYIEQMNATFLNEIAELLLELIARWGLAGRIASLLKEAERILVTIYENCPALSRPCFLLAKVKIINKDFVTAEALLKHCIEKDHVRAESYLLLAQIHLQLQRLQDASNVLDTGLGYNFKVREHPIYFLTKAKLEKSQGRVEMAVDLLESAIQMPSWNDRLNRKGMELDSERLAIYMELIDSLRLLNRLEDADAYMSTAMRDYAARADLQHRLVLIDADLQLRRGNADGALAALHSIRPEQENYEEARIKMAQIYLEHKHDKHKYTLCYRNILEQKNSPHAYELLGDAYMNVQEPNQAIDAYESAMRRNPKDHALAEKIANAYVKCHLYNKAIIFYEAAMKSGRKNILRIRFAKQLFQMGNFEKCKKVLRDVVDEGYRPTEINDMRDHVEYLCLLSKLHLEQKDWANASANLDRARQIQLEIVAQLSASGDYARKGTSAADNNLVDEKINAARLCAELAEMYANRKDYSKAIEYYKEAISLNDKDIHNMLACASIYRNTGKVQLCNKQCQEVLALEPSNIDASLLMADILYQQSEGEEAIKHFAQILEQNPFHYHALARYLELVWRRGNVELMEKALRNPLENNPRVVVDAGYNYCRGLAEWFTGELHEALQAFNRARRDLEWGERALYNMIEICLSSCHENVAIDADANEIRDVRNETNEDDFGVKAAERFFKELRLKPGTEQKYKLIENFIALASTNKLDVQSALANFLDMCHVENGEAENNNNLNVGAVLGSARAYIILKQTPKAKAQLKLVLNYPWNLEDADYLQQCMLLLVELYINQGKHEQATAVLRTILQHNASCSKAYEYMGYICEKDQKYSDSASNYEVAWKLCKNQNATIGYKLAYNYCKCRRFFECIEVCHMVLKKYPDYPKIKKEILDKARANIRI